MKKNRNRIAKTICHLCQNFCGIDVHVKDGRPDKIFGMKEHPANKICMKAQSLKDIIYSPDRILHPMRQQNGVWKKISWNDAYDMIAENLSKIKEKYGARSLLAHVGYPPVGYHTLEVAKQFCHMFGSPNYTSGASICFAARVIGHSLTASLTLLPSFKDTGCVVVWGYNPWESRVRDAAAILSAKKNGAKLIVIDSRRTPAAQNADLYLRIKPGTDCALALGCLNVILEEKLYDKAFVDNWTLGFDALCEHVKSYTPEMVDKITWVPAEDIRMFARMYAGNRPATIAQGVSIDHCLNGINSSRAIATLIAVTGNIDIKGGSVCNLPLFLSDLSKPYAVSLDEGIGAAYPIFSKFVGETSMVPAIDALSSGTPYPIKALIADACNPMSNWPNVNRLEAGLKKLDLLVVADLFMTETAKMADIFLPAVHALEEELIHDHTFEGLPLIVFGEKVTDPPATCRENWRIWAELGRRLFGETHFPWQNTNELLSGLLKPTKFTLEQLRQHPGGIFYRDVDLEKKYEKKGFLTPSGKVEIYSQQVADLGYPALPTFVQHDTSKDYPLNLIGGSRVGPFVHSSLRNIERLRKRVPHPVVEIHPDTAKDLCIDDNDDIVLESPKGSISVKANVTPDIHPAVLSMPHGWAEANCNRLSDDTERDPISGYPGFRTVPCRVYKAKGL
jgi:anaerobic selenocysteine-containing dehydrogenase